MKEEKFAFLSPQKILILSSSSAQTSGCFKPQPRTFSLLVWAKQKCTFSLWTQGSDS